MRNMRPLVLSLTFLALVFLFLFCNESGTNRHETENPVTEDPDYR